MKTFSKERIVITLLALLAAAISPNLFPAAQAGISTMHELVVHLLAPSIVVLASAITMAFVRGHRALGRHMLAGLGAGAIATVALEVVRQTSFRLGGMPGDLPRLLGVLITDRFMLGPSSYSDALGYAYHFWNGACFGLIFAVLIGRRRAIWNVMYAIAIGIGFLASPAVRAMGVGFMGVRMPAMIVTVLAAHVAYGFALAFLLRRWLGGRERFVAIETALSAPEVSRS